MNSEHKPAPSRIPIPTTLLEQKDTIWNRIGFNNNPPPTRKNNTTPKTRSKFIPSEIVNSLFRTSTSEQEQKQQQQQEQHLNHLLNQQQQQQQQQPIKQQLKPRQPKHPKQHKQLQLLNIPSTSSLLLQPNSSPIQQRLTSSTHSSDDHQLRYRSLSSNLPPNHIEPNAAVWPSERFLLSPDREEQKDSKRPSSTLNPPPPPTPQLPSPIRETAPTHAPLKPLDVRRANHLSISHPRLDTQAERPSKTPSRSPSQVPNAAPAYYPSTVPPTSLPSQRSPPLPCVSPAHFRPPNRIVLRSRSMSDPFVRQSRSYFLSNHPLTPTSNKNSAEFPRRHVLSSTHQETRKPRPHLEHLARASLQCRPTNRPTGASLDSVLHTPEQILKLFEPKDSPSSSRVPDEEHVNEVVSIVDTPEATAALNVKADFVIGVAGPKGVGKSTIIDKALRKPTSSSHSSVTLYQNNSGNKITSTVSSIQSGTTGDSKTLQILEIDQQILTENFIVTKKNTQNNPHHTKEGLLTWPERLPHLDGVLLCYDAMDPKALDHLRPLLHSFWTRGGICLIVLACKSSKDEKSNATSPLKAAELVNVYGTGMIQLDGGLEDPTKKMRNSFNWIMKAIKDARGEHRSYSSASTCVLESLCSEENPTGLVPPSSTGLSNNTHLHSSSNASEVLRSSAGAVDDNKSHDESLSPDHTPRKSSILPVDIPPSLVADTLLNSLVDNSQVDDGDGDSFSNNVLVAMSYEKSTRPDGSFKDDDQQSNSSKSSPKEPEPDEPVLPTSPLNPTHHQKSITTLSFDEDGKPSSFSTGSPSLDEIKSFSASGKHAAQKALIISQRGSDLELYFEKHVVIDKFVFATVSGNDPSFVDQFIIIYRRFATPFDVLSALIARFEFVSGHLETDPLLGRYAHLKICHVLMSWLENYPGDFVQTPTLTILKAFNILMLSVTWLLHYAVEMMPMIKSLANMPDEDAGWALPDCTDNSAVEKVLETIKTLQVSLAPHSARAREMKHQDSADEQGLPSTPHTTVKSMDGGSSSIPYPFSESSPHINTFSSTFMSTDQVASTAASSPVIAMTSNTHLQHQDRNQHQNHYHKLSGDQHMVSSIEPIGSIDSAENFSVGSIPLRTTLTSSTHQSDSKLEFKALLDASNQLIALSEDSIALQITRLEWGIFATMKPRHLVRYVLAPRDPNNPRKALRDPNSPIAKSTEYLNHLAIWASSVILIQDKLKSRAKILLKLMKVAYELRDMDDFHSLMGVLAGIEAQPVYRLDATFDLVKNMDLQAYRRYLSLKKLMSSQRSFSAYRLARQTASSQCVPYLGTYLQDITSVNEVKDDMKDGKVNLTKFLQMSKSASSVINCNVLAPQVFFDKKISHLIVKAPFLLSEDLQYDLSYKYKPRVLNSSSNILHSSNSNHNNNHNHNTSGGGGGGGGNSSTTTTASNLLGLVSGGSSGFIKQQLNNQPSLDSQPPHLDPITPTSTSNSHATTASLVAKKGTRKLKQLINTAINH